MPASAKDDPLARLWPYLFVGDRPGNRTLTQHTDGQFRVEDRIPDGGTVDRSFTVAGTTSTVTVPTFTSRPCAQAATIEQVVAQLAARGEAPMGPMWEPPRPAAAVAARPLGRLDRWLAAQDGPDGMFAAAAAGRPHRCGRCGGSGAGVWLACRCVPRDPATLTRTGDPDPACDDCGGDGRITFPCVRCAGSGMRCSSVTARIVEQGGGAYDVALDASCYDLELIPASAGRPASYQVRLRDGVLPTGSHAATLLRTDGQLLVETGGAVWLYAGISACPASAGPAGVLGAFLRRLPGGVDPTLLPRRIAGSAARAAEHECSFDDRGRASSRQLRIRPARTATAAWEELWDLAVTVGQVHAAGWQLEVSLATGMIATGEYGPQVRVVAVPPAGRPARPRVLAEQLDGELVRAVEGVVAELRVAVATGQLLRSPAALEGPGGCAAGRGGLQEG